MADDGGTAPSGIAVGGLRTGSDLDPTWELRPFPAQMRLAPTLDLQDRSLGEPNGPAETVAEDPDDTAAQADDAEAAPSRLRPKIDLFEGPSPPASAAQRESASTNPAGPVDDPAAAVGSLRPGPPTAASRAVDPAVAAAVTADPSTGVRPPVPDLALPPAMVRTGLIDSRLNLRDAPLRGVLPNSDGDPFAPTGIRLGSLVLTTAVDQSFGVSNNLDRTPDGAGGAFSETTLSARFLSGWTRHAAELNGLATYRRNFAGEETSDPDVKLDGRLGLDIDRLTTAALKGAVSYRKEDAADLDPAADSRGRPDLLDYTASAELERQFGPAFARTTLAAVRETTSRGTGAAPGIDQDFGTYTAALRGGYRLSPALAPFVEASAGRRIFDVSRDALDRRRDSTVGGLRGGLALDFTEKLSGELAAGYAWNLPDEDAFGEARSRTFDARIAWSPRRGTDLTLSASTTFDPDTTGSTTATLYQTGIAARHRAAARLDLDAAFTAGYRRSRLASDEEQTFGVSTGFTYWFSRYLALIGLASHEGIDRLHGSGDYEVDTVKLGIRMQN